MDWEKNFRAVVDESERLVAIKKAAFTQHHIVRVLPPDAAWTAHENCRKQLLAEKHGPLVK